MEKFNNLLQELDFCGYEEGIEKIKEAGMNPEATFVSAFDEDGADRIEVSVDNYDRKFIFEIMCSYGLDTLEQAIEEEGFWIAQ